MSDAMTNAEIEDVLSSIRRLVSEDTRPKPAPAAPVVTEKLVLTPSLRVLPDVEQPQEIIEDEAQAPSAGAETDDAIEESAEPSDDRRASLLAAIAELEAAVAKRGDDFEPDGSEAPRVSADFEASFHAATDDSPQDGDDTAGNAEEQVQPEPETEARLIEGAQPEPELEPAPEVEEVGEWLDEEEMIVEAVEAEIDTGDAAIFEDSSGDFLDEDAVRDMVRDIIRQELQGTLGERITRNVRKLVRVEVNRALLSRDFE